VNDRERAVTPRSLAAILNPDAPRAQGSESNAPVEAPATTGVPDWEWRNLRQRVNQGSGAMEFLLFSVGAESFALPLDSVREALDGADNIYVPDIPAHVSGVLSVAGRSIPVYHSTSFLGVATTVDRPSVLIMKGEREDAGLAVDALISSAEIELASVRRVPALEDAAGAFVGVFFHKGELFTLLDPAVFMRQRDAAKGGVADPDQGSQARRNAEGDNDV
jgi:purine-binding chemotaxis protein CheW